jgi:hypothetical protein
MKNIILQHYTGEMGELEHLSVANISRYADKCGADYKLVLGNVFSPELSPEFQKLFILDACWDNYDNVAMFDIDMFERNGQTENVFDVPGVGIYDDVQEVLHKGIYSNFPFMSSMETPYWGGAIYKMDKKMRKRMRRPLRSVVTVDTLKKFSRAYFDEGSMHHLAFLSHEEFSILPDGYKWCHCSFRPGIEDAAMIHVRNKVGLTGPKRPKIENYKSLVNKGLIEE